MGLNVVLKNDAEIVSNKVRANLGDCADVLAEKAVEWIQEKMLYGYHDPHGPDGHTEIVDTGATFDSAAARVQKNSQNSATVSAGVDTSYAPFVHNGTRKLKGRPFVRDAMIDNQGNMKSILEDIGSGLD